MKNSKDLPTTSMHRSIYPCACNVPVCSLKRTGNCFCDVHQIVSCYMYYKRMGKILQRQLLLIYSFVSDFKKNHTVTCLATTCVRFFKFKQIKNMQGIQDTRPPIEQWYACIFSPIKIGSINFIMHIKFVIAFS